MPEAGRLCLNSLRVVVRTVGALALAALLSGCIETDIEGAANYVGSIGGLTDRKPDPKPRVVQIFIASTREGESGAAAQEIAPEGTRFALTTFTFPPGHKPGAIERPVWGSGDARKDIMVAGRRELDADEFKAELASHVSGRIGVNRDVMIFVHGFNTPFSEARWRAAQIVADSRFGGVPILFTWPSRGGLLNYASDKESATASRDGLQGLVEDVAKTPGVGRIHILAHSMGAWLAMEALRQEAIASNRDLDGHLGEVMLASPDIDLEVFTQQMARIRPAKVTVFATSNDRALSLSSWIAADRPRVGAVNAAKPEDKAALEALGAKVYDLSAFSDGLIDHGIYADTPDVIHAIGAQLTAPRASDANTVSIIDARGDAAPAPAASAPAAPAPPAASPAPANTPATPAPVTVAPLAPVSPPAGPTP
jgi:esterase/lipase superfamily enzyme